MEITHATNERCLILRQQGKLDTFGSKELDAAFEAKNHNHAVIFSELPISREPASLETEISSVVENGDFCDMRHLLDRSALTQALIGISYIQNFRKDPKGARTSPR
jgi:hypothetical protein